MSIYNSYKIGIHEIFFSTDIYNQRYGPTESYNNEILLWVKMAPYGLFATPPYTVVVLIKLAPFQFS